MLLLFPYRIGAATTTSQGWLFQEAESLYLFTTWREQLLRWTVSKIWVGIFRQRIRKRVYLHLSLIEKHKSTLSYIKDLFKHVKTAITFPPKQHFFKRKSQVLSVFSKNTYQPWLVCLAGLSVGCKTKQLPLRFPVGHMPGLQGQVPSGGHSRGHHTLMLLFSPSKSK